MQQWEEAERQNIVLQGDRHKEDVASAVEAAQKVTELVMKAECENVCANLHKSLTESHTQELHVAKMEIQARMHEIQKRINAVFADAPQS